MDRDSIYSSLPLARSFWVVPGRLLAGAYPGDANKKDEVQKLHSLLEAGVTTIINLMEVDERNGQGAAFRPYAPTIRELAQDQGTAVHCLRFPIQDLGVPSHQQMRLILDTIDDQLSQGRRVYLHSRSGSGRTGTVVGCFLARHGLASGEAILERLAVLRRRLAEAESPSPETVAQRTMVLGWREGE